ncbi:uncharacterized protein LOC115217462 [Argonauta hians]
MAHIFHGYELLLFKRFHAEPSLWLEWKNKLLEKSRDAPSPTSLIDLEDIGGLPQGLWYLSVTLHKRQRYLMHLIREEAQKEKRGCYKKTGETLLSLYLNYYQFTEFHLDSIFKYGDDNRLPREIFKCPNVTHLSLKYNSLDHLPADIGRMKQLEYLALTNNKLQVSAIPYTLTFCTKLKTILLDNNLLDALPGFLLTMPSIETVYRHGNHNYFKATFMWYHTDVNYRIIPAGGFGVAMSKVPASLQFWAAKSVIGQKIDFYNNSCIADILKDYISELYYKFYLCHYCKQALLRHLPGYKVITFKNPYLGNSCVPFQHWACSLDCAKALEVPARIEQIAAATKLDRQYEDYVNRCQQLFRTVHSGANQMCVCSRESLHSSCPSGAGDNDGRSHCHYCTVLDAGRDDKESSCYCCLQ